MRRRPTWYEWQTYVIWFIDLFTQRTPGIHRGLFSYTDMFLCKHMWHILQLSPQTSLQPDGLVLRAITDYARECGKSVGVYVWMCVCGCAIQVHSNVYMTRSYVTWFIHTWHDSCMCDITRARSFCTPSLTTRAHETQAYVIAVTWGWGGVLRSSVRARKSTIAGRTNLASFHLRVTWLIHIWRDSCICDVTLSYATSLVHVRHDSFMCGMTHSCAPWLATTRHTAKAP